MATVIDSKKSSVGSPYCYYTLKMTYSNRTTTSVKVSWTLTAKLASSSSTMGYSLTAYVYAGSDYQKKSLKGTSTWTGTSAHTIEGSFTVSGLSASTSKISTALKVTSGAPANACQLNKTSGSNLTIATIPTYTISYNANGGSGAPAAQTKYKGTDIKISSTIPKRTGYTFKRWVSTRSDGSVVYYAPSENVTYDGNQTLVAEWIIDTYTITYNANGGTGAPAAQTKTYGTTLTLSSTKPTRTDSADATGAITKYTFLGWSTSPSAATPTYLAGASYITNAAATLYAVWSETDGYLILYNTGDGSAVATQNKPIGVSVEITSDISIRHGYTFTGWSTSVDDTTVDYVGGDIYSTDSNITLYAIWTPWTHTVQFNSNGGNNDIPNSFVKTTGIEVLIPDTKPARAGYIFSGWNAQPDGSGDYYYSGELYENAQNGGSVILYAIWTSTDILIYENGCCKALGFKEGTNCLKFINDGTIEAVEFIEGRTLAVDGTGFCFTEILEQHNIYKVKDESELFLTDELSNRLYYIQ